MLETRKKTVQHIIVIFTSYCYLFFILKNSSNEESHGGGRLQTISNFFQNLTPGHRRAARSSHSDASSPSDTTGFFRESLPPIETGNHSHLITPVRNAMPSYGHTRLADERNTFGQLSHSGGPSSPCGPNCIHQKHSRGQRSNDSQSGDNQNQAQHNNEGTWHHSPRLLAESLDSSNKSKSEDGTQDKKIWMKTSDELK